VESLQDILEAIGLERDRIRMVNVSAAMAGEFVEYAEEMTEKIMELGPNPFLNL
jgi:coenzyme F420-reducing hydrogenase delta subunit